MCPLCITLSPHVVTVIDESLDLKSRLIQSVLDYAQHNDSYFVIMTDDGAI